MINELSTTLEDAGLEVDQRYLMLVSDLMCHRGYMQQIGRHGIAGTKDSVLARAAFEITVPTIAGAARTGEVEQLKRNYRKCNCWKPNSNWKWNCRFVHASCKETCL